MHSIERIDFHIEQNTLILISRALAAGLGARNLIEVSAFCPVIARASPHALLTRPLAPAFGRVVFCPPACGGWRKVPARCCRRSVICTAPSAKLSLHYNKS